MPVLLAILQIPCSRAVFPCYYLSSAAKLINFGSAMVQLKASLSDGHTFPFVTMMQLCRICEPFFVVSIGKNSSPTPFPQRQQVQHPAEGSVEGKGCLIASQVSLHINF